MSDIQDAHVGDLFVDKSGRPWTIVGVCQEPTVIAVRMTFTGDDRPEERIHAGVSGLLFDGFKRVWRGK